MSGEKLQTESVGIFTTVKNKRVIELLQRQGKNVIEFPHISIRKLEMSEQDVDLLKKIKTFDWLIFADVFAVDYFLDELKNSSFDLFELDDFRICACGEAVADKLRFSQIHSDVIPPKISADKVISSIFEYIYEAEQFLNSTFLIIKTRNKHSEISECLSAKELNFSEFSVCEIENIGDLSKAKLKTLIAGGAIDRFMFTSPEDIDSFIMLSDNALQILTKELKIEAADELTAQAFREIDIRI